MIRFRNIVFYHMPRTAGTWVGQCLRAVYGRDQVRISAHHSAPLDDGEHRADDYHCTFWRNPFDWVRSWFAWQQAHHWKGMTGVSTVMEKYRHQEFGEFLARLIDDRADVVSFIYETYAASGVRVGQTEAAPYDLARFLREAGVEDVPTARILAFPRRNGSMPKTIGALDWPDALTVPFYEANAALFPAEAAIGSPPAEEAS